MTTTFIKTGDCARMKAPGNQGEVSEIVNNALCGAKNVLGMLRWLGPGQQFDAQAPFAPQIPQHVAGEAGHETGDRGEQRAGPPPPLKKKEN